MKNKQTLPDTQILEKPPFDKKLLVGIKGIGDIVPILPKYIITLKEADYAGRIKKTAVWVGYFHSISDSGFNYNLDEIEHYKLLI